ncbi:efflux RND transporter periplasmic adaptor subunit [Colwellia ponticola]|uniref:Efflux RND transporter periplasmic adaptor subunit n=1 Tax=Colwellia ponticola TaxID=2304625 RepID=A0A8H2JN44_9GAMM|nr:efflux RND transporter periplasmic adaptor subunit [Colwellia ponticola]TMM46449.1 efflux RND transporter periplasmic adaptor subunit [Colwellia ponticola]
MYKYIIPVAIAISTLTLTACSPEPSQVAQQPQLQSIDVAEVMVKPVQSWHTYTSRLEAPEQVALKPRVSGVIDHIAFNEGQQIKQGDLLFTLDNRPFSAIVASLDAQINSAKAALTQARSEEQRAIRLTEQKAISTEQAESRTSTLRQREAQLAALQAQLKAAQLDLEFTEIRSPIDGLISRANITKGNNVLAGQSVLTTIVSNKAMYAYFDIDERTWNNVFANVTAADKQHVVMQKIGQEDFPYQGYIDFIDNQINAATGTLRVRAVFNEDQNQLRAGSFARIKMAATTITDRIVIPARAIGTDLKNRFVLVVGDNNILQYKQVEVGERYGNFRAITSGLTATDIIAVNGPARVGPGMPIAPNHITLDSSGVAFTLSSVADSNLSAEIMSKPTSKES